MTDQTTRSIDLSVEVPGTPEQVWEAIATGPGITSWFIPTQVEGRDGGAIVMDFGAMGKEEASVAAYEPPHRFVGASSRGETQFASEWLVEAREGGTCVVRLVQSGFGTGAEWDAEYNGTTEGWKLFLENLRLHLTYFAGETATAIMPMAIAQQPSEPAWVSLCSALGVSADLAVGDRLLTAGEGVPALTGVVSAAKRSDASNAYVLVLDGDRRGTALIASEGAGDKGMLSLWVYLYGGDPAALDRELSAFLGERFTVPGA